MTHLEQLRLDARLSPEQLAEQSGVAGSTIRRLESGKGAQVATLGKLADFFDVPVSSLLLDAREPEREAA